MTLSSQLGSIRLIPSKGFFQFENRLIEVWRDPGVGPADLCKALLDYLKELTVRGIPDLEVELVSLPEDFEKYLIHDQVLRTIKLAPIDFDIALYENQPVQSGDSRNDNNLLIDELLERKCSSATFYTYKGRGQRDAVRSALLLKRNDKLIVNLPTGSGKSLVFQALASLHAKRYTVICVVPTIALKIEQARRYADEFLEDNSLSWRDLIWPPIDDSGENRKHVLRCLQSARYPIIFCAPESLDGAFLETIKSCVSNSTIRSIVVDEAHLIEQWGGTFRVHYQVLPLVFGSLQELAPKGLQFVLLSATWSVSVLNRITDLFRDTRGDLHFVDAGTLRPEPSYEFAKIDPHQKLQSAISEVMCHPSPAIVYTLKKADANKLYEGFTQFGFQRIGLFTGDTSDNERSLLIDKWQKNQIDIMFATDAFGVGMDKSDVRTVLHVGFPQTLDRLYQESGRGGRDGRASCYKILFCDQDIQIAKRMANPAIIGGEKAHSRFSKMIDGSVARLEQGHLVLDPSATPAYIDHEGDQNEGWNWKTLLFLQRLGVLSLRLLHQDEYKNIRRDNDPVFPGMQYLKVKVLEGSVDSDSFWKEGYEQGRKKVTNENKIEQLYLDKLVQAVKQEQNICDLLRDYLSFNGASPELSCRRCPGHDASINQIIGSSRNTLMNLRKTDKFGQSVFPVTFSDETLTTEDESNLVKAIEILALSGQIQAVRCSQDMRMRILNRLSTDFRGFFYFVEPKSKVGARELFIFEATDLDRFDFVNMSFRNLCEYIVGPEAVSFPGEPFFWTEKLGSTRNIKSFLRRCRNGSE